MWLLSRSVFGSRLYIGSLFLLYENPPGLAAPHLVGGRRKKKVRDLEERGESPTYQKVEAGVGGGFFTLLLSFQEQKKPPGHHLLFVSPVPFKLCTPLEG